MCTHSCKSMMCLLFVCKHNLVYDLILDSNSDTANSVFRSFRVRASAAITNPGSETVFLTQDSISDLDKYPLFYFYFFQLRDGHPLRASRSLLDNHGNRIHRELLTRKKHHKGMQWSSRQQSCTRESSAHKQTLHFTRVKFFSSARSNASYLLHVHVLVLILL